MQPSLTPVQIDNLMMERGETSLWMDLEYSPREYQFFDLTRMEQIEKGQRKNKSGADFIL